MQRSHSQVRARSLTWQDQVAGGASATSPHTRQVGGSGTGEVSLGPARESRDPARPWWPGPDEAEEEPVTAPPQTTESMRDKVYPLD